MDSRSLATDLKFLPSGDRGLLVKVGETVDPKISLQVHALREVISKRNLYGVEDLVPAYCSLLILFDPLKTNYHSLVRHIQDLHFNPASADASPQRCIEIPICYDIGFGPDLADVAAIHRITEAEVIRQHSNVNYLVYFIGFCPGFPYMGEVPSSIATPRLPRPRVRVPAGSVGIAGNQTGIYPIETPGGWRLIGRTPLKLFDPRNNPPNLLVPGDGVRFVSISRVEFEAIDLAVRRGSYRLVVS